MMKRSTLLKGILVLIAGDAATRLAGCGGGNGGPKGPSLRSVRGRLLAEFGGLPVADAAVSLRTAGGTQTTRTDASGDFAVGEVETGSLLIVQRPDGGSNVYSFAVTSDFDTAEFQAILNPVAAAFRTLNLAAGVLPSEANPAGTAFITSARFGDSVGCSALSPPSTCRFNVSGTADPRLGQPGAAYRAYVLVHPVAPSGLSGFFPQFPKLAIDPQTGNWETEVQIGPPTQTGNRFELTLVVTSVELTPGSPVSAPLEYQAPVDVPGVVFVAPFVQNLAVG